MACTGPAGPFAKELTIITIAMEFTIPHRVPIISRLKSNLSLTQISMAGMSPKVFETRKAAKAKLVGLNFLSSIRYFTSIPEHPKPTAVSAAIIAATQG